MSPESEEVLAVIQRLPEQMSLTLVRNDLLCSCNYIAGQWREGRAGKRLPVSDPANGLVLAQRSR